MREEQAQAAGTARRGTVSKDRWAFGFLVAFGVAVYTVPAAWIPGFASARPALLTSGLAAAFFFLRRLGRAEPVFLDGARGISLLFFVALSFLSAQWSVAPEVSRATGAELVKLAAIYLMVVNVVTTPKRLAVFCGALVLASTVASIGVIQWYLNGEDLVEGYRGRWFGVYADPNHMAMDIGLVVPLAAAFVGRRENHMLMRIASAIAMGLAVTAVVVSHSRGGFIGLSVGMMIWALREARRMQSIAVAAAFILGLLIFAPSSFWARNETVTTFEDDVSAMGRVYAWEVAAGISSDHPLVGVGSGAFRQAWPLYAPPEAHRAFVAHNVFLDVVAEVGWIGLLLFLTFVAGTIGGVFGASADPAVGWIARGLAAATVLYLVCDLFSGYILSAHFYLLFALAAAAQRMAVPVAALAPEPPLRHREVLPQGGVA